MTIPAIKKRRFEEPWEWLKMLVSRDQIYYIYIYITRRLGERNE
jgi:hypothetical protein